MPQLTQQKSIFNSLKRLRLCVARSTLRNCIDILAPHADIAGIDQVEELCDEYALRALLLWLSTKYGSAVYNSAIESEMSCRVFSLCKPLLHEGEFPFLNQPFVIDDQSLIDECEAAMAKDFAPRFDLIGSLYEQIVNFPLCIEENKAPEIPTNIQGKDNRRRVGQFYTPPSAVDYCLTLALGEDSAPLMKAIKSGIPYTVFDPACGSGNFLIGTLRRILQWPVDNAGKIWFATHCLFGVELDGRAASLARLGIMVSLVPVLSQMDDVEAERAVFDLLSATRRNISTGDSVFNASLLPQGEDAQVLCERSPHQPLRFDLVVTNPPYISYGARNQPVLSLSSSKFLRSQYPEGAEYKIRLHSIFQDIALRYTKSMGAAVLLVPDGFLTGSYYGRLRKMLLRRARLRQLSELPDDTIPNAVVGRWCAAAYTKDDSETKADYDVDLTSLLKDAVRHRLPLSILVSKDKSRFRLIFNETDESICRLVDRLPVLRDVMQGHTGIRAIKGQSSIVSQQCLGQLWKRGIRSGSCVHKFGVRWDGTFILIDPSLLFKGGFDEKIVACPKLLVRQTADRLIAAYDDSGLYHLNNVHSFSAVNNSVDLHYLASLFNSRFWLYLYRLKTREDGRALAQIDIETVESLALPHGKPEIEAALTDLSLRLSASFEQSDGDLVSFIERCIDRLVYDLYELSQSQIEHVETVLKGREQVLPDADAVFAYLQSQSKQSCRLVGVQE